MNNSLLLCSPKEARTLIWDADGVSPLNDGAGNWAPTGGTNWFYISTYRSWINDSIAVFGVNNGPAGTVTILDPLSVGGIRFLNPGSGTYYLLGGQIFLFGINPVIEVSSTEAIIQSVLSGSQGLTKTGNGTLILASPKTYSGTTFINSGTIKLGVSQALTGSVRLGTLASSGTIDLLGFDTTLSSLTVLGSGNKVINTNISTTSQLTLNIGNNTYSGRFGTNTLDNNFSIIKTGNGTLTLIADALQPNTFNGGLYINQGTVIAQNSMVVGGTNGNSGNIILGDTSGSNSAIFYLGANNVSIFSQITVNTGSSGVKSIGSTGNLFNVNYNGNIIANDSLYIFNGTGGGSLTFGANNPISINIASGKVLTFAGSGGNAPINTGTSGVNYATISGGGSVSLFGNIVYNARDPSTYTGGFSALGGAAMVAVISSAGPAGNPTSGPMGAGTTPAVLNNMSIRSTTGSDQTIGNPIHLTGDTRYPTIASEKNLTLTGPITLLNGSRTLTVDIGSTVTTTALRLSGIIGDNGNGYGIIKSGSGRLVLSGINTYTGNTSILNGTLFVTTVLSGPAKINNAAFTNTTLSVNFNTGPLVGETYRLFPGATTQTYASVTLTGVGVAGRTGTYNSTNSTLTIS